MLGGVRDERRLRFVQVLAGALVACGGSAQAPTTPTTATAPSATPSTSTSATASATATNVADSEPADPTAGSGPCRCSWDTNAANAPRVCKKGQTSITGAVCNPGNHQYKPQIKVGPLEPPDLA